jgi:hypothetical protein
MTFDYLNAPLGSSMLWGICNLRGFLTLNPVLGPVIWTVYPVVESTG